MRPAPGSGSIVLISGCSTGIGRALALRLAAVGATVVAGARNTATLAGLAEAFPGRIEAIAWNVDDPAATREAVLGTLSRHGRLDVLVNNAGYGQFGPLVDLSREEWRRQFETNVVGLVDAAAIAARAPGGMIDRRRGLIVNIGSILGRFSVPFSGAYSASKHAVEAISDTLRLELRPFGIDVLLVEPGPVTTAFSATALRILEGHLSGGDSPYEYLRPVLEARASESRTGAIAAEACAAEIVRAVMRPRPPSRIRITRLARAAYWLRKLLPDRLFDALLVGRYGLNRPAPRP